MRSCTSSICRIGRSGISCLYLQDFLFHMLSHAEVYLKNKILYLSLAAGLSVPHAAQLPRGADGGP
jgi:hypothetical protein